MDDENTPIEKYNVKGHDIWVKREDLFMASKQPPYPSLAKLRGARVLLAKLANQGIRKVGVFDTRISKAGQGIACICKELGLECWAGFQQLKDIPIADRHRIAKLQGAELFPLRAGRTAIAYYQFKKFVENSDGYMLPLGLVCQETVDAVECLARGLGKDFNSIVLSVGTGTIITGVAKGTSAKVYGVSCGMSNERQWRRIHTLAPGSLLFNLQLIPPEYSYYDALDTISCPFPTSSYYDMKAWVWLLKNIDRLEKPLLFWNIGA